MTGNGFSIIPATSATYLSITVIVLLAVVPLILGAFFLFRKSGQMKIPKIIFVVAAMIVLFICVMFLYFAYSAAKTQFIVSDEGLEIKGCLYGRAVSKESIDKERVKIINLMREQDYRPVVRTNGVGLPGYLSGWFRLKNGEKALLFVTNQADVIYVPTSEGYCVLLSPSEPADFLNMTRQMWND